MRKNIYLLLLLPAFIHAQTNTQVLYLNKDMEPCRADSAKFYRVGLMVDGLPQGAIKDYYASGKLYMQGQYNANHEPEGYFYFFYEDGKRKERGHFVKDIYRVQKIWDKDGNVQVNHGKGEVREHYENGTTKFEGKFNHGLRDGVWNFYHRNGQKYETGEYKFGVYFINNAWDRKGKLTVENGTGTYTSYYSNGALRVKGNYVSGLRTGKWEWRFPNGQIERVGVFDEGLEVGLHVEYYNTGKFRTKSGYQAGLLHGVYLCYYTNGRIRYSCEFRNGQICSDLTHFDETGKRVPSYDNEDGPHWQSFNTRIVKNKWW